MTELVNIFFKPYWAACLLIYVLLSIAARDTAGDGTTRATNYYEKESTAEMSTAAETTIDGTTRVTYYESESTTEISTEAETTTDTTTDQISTTRDILPTQKQENEECGTLTSQEYMSSLKRSPLGVRFDGVQNVVKGSAPWAAGVYKNKRDLMCAGTLIKSRWVVTNANCFHGVDSRNVYVRIGDHLRQSTGFIQVKNISYHGYFDPNTLNNDIALIELDSPVKRYTSYVKPICLADKDRYDELIRGGALGRVTKWRESSEGDAYLTEAYIPFEGYPFCKAYFRKRRLSFTPNMFCAGYSIAVTDPFFGDIGGSFSVQDENGKWYLVGILSRDQEYYEGHNYGVYTRYPKYYDWVEKILIRFW